MAQQEEPPREAIWLYRYDARVDGVLERPIVVRLQLTYENGRFSGGVSNGKVRDKANNAVITAELLFARSTPILVMKQYEAPTGGAAAYYAVCTAYRAGKNIYRGTWYDCAGFSGDFEMVLKEQ
jgi:hypothetical protein